MSANVLVTGATGRAGTEMVHRLVAAGVRVRAASHYPDREADSRADAVDYVEVDLDDATTLDIAFKGVEKAVLITPEDAHMVRMTRHLVQAAERAGVSRLVRVSFINAGSGEGGPLLEWHREAEEIVAASPIPSTCLRPNSYMQNFLTMYAPSIFVHGAFYTPMGQGRISYVDGRDVAEAGVAALLGDGHDGTTYDLTGPAALGHDEIAAILSREAGQPIRYVDVGDDHACSVLEHQGASPLLTDALCDLWMGMRRDAFAPVSSDFERLTGRPPHSFEEFARDHHAEVRVSRTAKSSE